MSDRQGGAYEKEHDGYIFVSYRIGYGNCYDKRNNGNVCGNVVSKWVLCVLSQLFLSKSRFAERQTDL